MGLPASAATTEEDEAKLVQLCVLCGADIYSIHLTHQACHFDVYEQLVSKCPHLEDLLVTYQVLNAAVTFKLDMIGMRQADCLSIQRVLRLYPGLKSLSLPGNRIDADMLKAILSGLIKNNTLTRLDLSHNLIDDVGATAIGTILSKKDLAIREIDLSGNSIRAEGAKALGRALSTNTVITTISLRLNRLGDQGGASIFDRLKAQNKTLTSINVSHNQLGAESAKAISEFLHGNTTLICLDVSGNELQEEGGKMLAEAVTHAAALREVDARNCGLGEAEEACIQKHAQKRVQQLKAAETEALEQLMRDDVGRVVAEKVRKSHGV
jgi:Ran GTPase-activating protein (RanGAP) involved in mRNA processing and transport